MLSDTEANFLISYLYTNKISTFLEIVGDVCIYPDGDIVIETGYEKFDHAELIIGQHANLDDYEIGKIQNICYQFIYKHKNGQVAAFKQEFIDNIEAMFHQELVKLPCYNQKCVCELAPFGGCIPKDKVSLIIKGVLFNFESWIGGFVSHTNLTREEYTIRFLPELDNVNSVNIIGDSQLIIVKGI